MTKRWWIPNNHPNVAAVRRAFEWLDEATPAGQRAGLVTLSGRALHGGDIELVLGKQAINELRKRRDWLLPSGGRLAAVSIRGNHGGIRFGGPLLLVYPDKKLLDFADDASDVTEIMVLPWARRDVAWWVAQWKAVELGETQRGTSETPSDLNPVVCAAFRQILGGRILIPTDGKLRPKDRAPVINMLSLLLDNQEAFTSEQLRSWAVTAAGCSTAFADDLADLAERVASGRERRPATWQWSHDALAKWRAVAAAHAGDISRRQP